MPADSEYGAISIKAPVLVGWVYRTHYASTMDTSPILQFVGRVRYRLWRRTFLLDDGLEILVAKAYILTKSSPFVLKGEVVLRNIYHKVLPSTKHLLEIRYIYQIT